MLRMPGEPHEMRMLVQQLATAKTNQDGQRIFGELCVTKTSWYAESLPSICTLRLVVAKYSLVHGIPYKVETSKPEEYKAVCPLAHVKSPDEQRRIWSFQISTYKSFSKKKASMKFSRTSVLERSLECNANKKSTIVKC
jgi:hypothetical protein